MGERPTELPLSPIAAESNRRWGSAACSGSSPTAAVMSQFLVMLQPGKTSTRAGPDKRKPTFSCRRLALSERGDPSPNRSVAPLVADVII